MCEPELDLLSRLEQELATTLSALKVENEEISQQETDYKARERELATSAAAAATAALKRESELAQRVDDLGAALEAARREAAESADAYQADRTMQETQLHHQRLLTEEFERQVRVLGDELGASSETLATLQRQHTLLLRELQWREEREAEAAAEARDKEEAAAEHQRRLRDADDAAASRATSAEGSNVLGHALAAEFFAARDRLHAHFSAHMRLPGVERALPVWAEPLVYDRAPAPPPALPPPSAAAPREEEERHSSTAFSPDVASEEEAAWMALSTSAGVVLVGGDQAEADEWGSATYPPSPPHATGDCSDDECSYDSAGERPAEGSDDDAHDSDDVDFGRATLQRPRETGARAAASHPFGLSPVQELSTSLRRREEALNTPAAAAAAPRARAVAAARAAPLRLELGVVEEELSAASDAALALVEAGEDGCSPEHPARLLERPQSRRSARPLAASPLSPPAALALSLSPLPGVGKLVVDPAGRAAAVLLPTKSRAPLSKRQRAKRVVSAYAGTSGALRSKTRRAARKAAKGRQAKKKRATATNADKENTRVARGNGSAARPRSGKAAKQARSRAEKAKTSRAIYSHAARLRTASSARRGLGVY